MLQILGAGNRPNFEQGSQHFKMPLIMFTYPLNRVSMTGLADMSFMFQSLIMNIEFE